MTFAKHSFLPNISIELYAAFHTTKNSFYSFFSVFICKNQHGIFENAFFPFPI